eukprot:gb/GFBE01040803.1/.p1 GENE.gb/GFBE01040803.1/~~gb/GFBE01040803.1/.p1  ORF type:complete len:210 (+),score=39.53 gb/GFBE01040803.1/:1-630(+)
MMPRARTPCLRTSQRLVLISTLLLALLRALDRSQDGAFAPSVWGERRISRIPRNFFNEVIKQTPDFMGKRRQDAAAALAKAKIALEEALDLQAKGLSHPGTWYQVTTEGEDGIGIRDEPELDGGRTGEDLVKGTRFDVDEIIETDGEPTFLRLADGKGYVFDTSPIDPENPSVKKLEGVFEGGKTIAELEEDVKEARRVFDEIRGGARR